MSGYIGNLSKKQAAGLAEFREKISDILQEKPVYDDDHNLLRWLRARNFDVKKSEAMLRTSLSWRSENNVNSMLDSYEPPEVMRKYFGGSLCGQAKDGSLIYIDPYGYTDMKGILMSLKKQEVIKGRVWFLEEIYRQFREKTQQQGRRVDQVTAIFDMENFGMKQLWKPGVDAFIGIVSVCESNYPETLKKAFVINAPRIFPVAYSLLRPFLSEETHRKVTICGANYQDVLLDYIDADQLPAHWGGTLTDSSGDPQCPSLVLKGSPVPKSYYGVNNLADVTGFTEANIGRGSSLQLDFPIEQPNSAIRWQFKTESFDIGFGVFRRTLDQRQSAKAMDAVIASQRVDSHMIPEDGILHCSQPGTYVVRFDNTFSWTRAKKLFYVIEVLEPKDLDLDGAADACGQGEQHDAADKEGQTETVWSSFMCNGDEAKENNESSPGNAGKAPNNASEKSPKAE